MKITVTFDSETERLDVLTNISALMAQPSNELEEIEKAFVRHLEVHTKDCYVQGAIKLLSIAKGPEYSKSADGLFEAKQ